MKGISVFPPALSLALAFAFFLPGFNVGVGVAPVHAAEGSAASDSQEAKWFFKKTLKIPKDLEGLTVDLTQPVAVFSVTLKNDSDGVIAGYDVSGGCGCFLHADGIGPIAPGETRTIDLWFHTEGLTKNSAEGVRTVWWLKDGRLGLRYASTRLHWKAE